MVTYNFIFKIVELETKVVLERRKLRLGLKMCLLQKNKKKYYLSQSFIPIIFFTVNFKYTLWLSYNYVAWEAANFFLQKLL